MGTCEGCGKVLGPFDLRYRVCFGCTQARHKAVVNGGRCRCHRGDRRESEVHQIGSRTWISCLRCLGQVRQLS